ncbi:MAG TPA: NAD(P)H-hydrate dehydratase [Ktedonobacterales bacterium]|nr:NAD(P)H-hydrate dehydratase [Ktedonobacterales bacterium]
MRVVSVEEMRAIEARAATEYGLDSPALMERAGRSVAEAVRDLLGGDASGRSVVTLVGPGNNGGDGLVMGHYLEGWGARVVNYRWREATLERMDGTLPVGDDLEELRGALAGADVVVDALLGTGHARPLHPVMREALALAARERERRLETHIVALDLPSGLNADTGAVDEGTVAADLTVTLAFPKTGLFIFPGAAMVGELEIGSIGLPDEMAIPAGLELVDWAMAREMLPPRPLDSNKGTFGKVMILAGSPSFIGAAALAGRGALRTGAGLVTIATTPERAAIYAAALPETTYHLLPADDADPAERARALLDGLRGYRALVVGPGLSQSPAVSAFLMAVFAGVRALDEAERPRLVVDADGLNALAKEFDWPRLLPPESVLTPHPGEISRLLGGEEVSGGGMDRLSVTPRAAGAWGHVVALKGGCTVIAAPDGRARINWPPNPALATAGTGDVLAGVTGALLAQGLPPFDAASLGVYLHGQAGLRVAARLGAAGAVAGDLPNELPLAIRETRGR